MRHQMIVGEPTDGSAKVGEILVGLRGHDWSGRGGTADPGSDCGRSSWRMAPRLATCGVAPDSSRRPPGPRLPHLLDCPIERGRSRRHVSDAGAPTPRRRFDCRRSWPPPGSYLAVRSLESSPSIKQDAGVGGSFRRECSCATAFPQAVNMPPVLRAGKQASVLQCNVLGDAVRWQLQPELHGGAPGMVFFGDRLHPACCNGCDPVDCAALS